MGIFSPHDESGNTCALSLNLDLEQGQQYNINIGKFQARELPTLADNEWRSFPAHRGNRPAWNRRPAKFSIKCHEWSAAHTKILARWFVLAIMILALYGFWLYMHGEWRWRK
jgi:hypothetical protein